jgi:hypothetical protein
MFEDLTQRASMGASIWPIVQGSFLNIFFITHYERKFSSINDADWADANVDLHKKNNNNNLKCLVSHLMDYCGMSYVTSLPLLAMSSMEK